MTAISHQSMGRHDHFFQCNEQANAQELVESIQDPEETANKMKKRYLMDIWSKGVPSLLYTEPVRRRMGYEQNVEQPTEPRHPVEAM